MSAKRGYLRYVNPLQGTDSHYGFSSGNTLPLTALPFAMNHWSPQTADDSAWYFSPHSRKLQGIRCTHQPSPWINDYGAFVLMPQTGRYFPSAAERSSTYRQDHSVIKPHHFKANLLRYRTTLEMVPTERGACFRIAFPGGETARILFQATKGESHWELRDDGTLAGWTRGNSGGALPGFAHYVVAEFSEKPTHAVEFGGDTRAGISVEFGAIKWVTVKLATSFISLEQAERNLRHELTDRSFDDLLQHAETEWESLLGQIEVEGSEEELATFYSCLYRTNLFPRKFHEYDASGAPIHYSPYTGNVHPGVLYTDNGFWDTYRTMYPLLALLQPARLSEILEGWVNAYKEGGWFPQWVSPGYRACMVGTHIDVVMADGVARGITGFDKEAALDGMLKHSTEPGDPAGAWGRIGITDYLNLGFVPADKHEESVARSLDYAYDDWCIAQMATALGRTEALPGLARSFGTYRNLYDPNVGFMRGKNADGTWEEPWDEFKWGSPYVEGGPWQSSWAVPHDAAGLIELNGGDEAFSAKLDLMLSQEPRYETGVYKQEIHEITEMAAADFGQYAHSNQPVHHVLYLYNAAGRPWRTQKEVRRVMAELYSPSSLPGDEDNGEMSAWYVLSALGFYPLTPGHASWTLGSPAFRKATVHLPNQKELIIEAPANSEKTVYVENLTWNGRPHPGLSLSHEGLANGGALHFAMAEHPTENVTPAELRPFSNTPYR